MTNAPCSEIDWQEDSRRFDGVADRYAAYRPAYPQALIDTLISITGIQGDSKILEIGSGTGKATLPFAQRGFSMLCIEPGKNLVAVAAQALRDFPRVEFETVAFEQWHERPREFDLVMSAQAFHWIPKAIGYAKAARALKETGQLALFWNMHPDPTGAIFLNLRKVYEECVPEWIGQSHSCEELIKQREADIRDSGCFGDIQVKRFPWSIKYDAAQYVGLLGTYSDHLRLPEERRQRLYQSVVAVITQHGGIIEKPYLAVLYVAQVRHNLLTGSESSSIFA
ncbi:MAG TPA: class I SAM-dependent methyltransferase [Anaerolineae bacterium]|nr:class I SAM-dependent methyltransferase [Anaerolineae bacterium]